MSTVTLASLQLLAYRDPPILKQRAAPRNFMRNSMFGLEHICQGPAPYSLNLEHCGDASELSDSG